MEKRGEENNVLLLIGCWSGTGEVSKGPCPDPKGCVCTKRQQPVCGVDNVTYDNRCQLDCAWVHLPQWLFFMGSPLVWTVFLWVQLPCWLSFVSTPSVLAVVREYMLCVGCCSWVHPLCWLSFVSTPSVLAVVRDYMLCVGCCSWVHPVRADYRSEYTVRFGCHFCELDCRSGGTHSVFTIVHEYIFRVDCRSEYTVSVDTHLWVHLSFWPSFGVQLFHVWLSFGVHFRFSCCAWVHLPCWLSFMRISSMWTALGKYTFCVECRVWVHPLCVDCHLWECKYTLRANCRLWVHLLFWLLCMNTLSE